MKVNSGVYTALITPFKDNGEVDYASFESLVDFQWKNGVKNFVVNGTTAESPTLERSEVEKLLKSVKSYNKDAFVILGTGSNSTQRTIESTVWAENLGADAALVVVPYYNKPTQEGMFQHFKKIASSVELPIMMYNVPGRTVVSMNAETTVRLSQINNIASVKEASGEMPLMKGIKASCKDGFQILSGDDGTCLDLCLLGGHGVVSVVSHIIPGPINTLIQKSMSGDDSSLAEFKKYELLLKYLYIEPNPVPAKMALFYMGIIKSPSVRLPLIKMTEANSNLFKTELEKLDLL